MIFVNDVINHEEHKRMYLSRIEEYKKTHDSIMPIGYTAIPSELEKNSKDRVVHSDSVSYTHLKLPTTPYV